MRENNTQFDNNMQLGHNAAWEEQWKQAAAFYRRALDIVPDEPAALNSLGLALYQQGEYSQSKDAYKKTTKVTPNDPVPYEKLADIYEKQNDLAEAAKVAAKAAENYLNVRDVNKAIENWVRIINLQPNQQLGYTKLAMIYEKMGKKDEAVDQYLNLASLMQQSGARLKAIQIVEHSLKMHPEHLKAKMALTALHNNERLPKPDPIQIKRKITQSLGEPKEEAVAIEEVEVEIDPVEEANQNSAAKLANFLFEQGSDAGGEGKVDSLRGKLGLNALTRSTGQLTGKQKDQTQQTFYVGQAIESISTKNYDKALIDLQKAVEYGADHPCISYTLGYLYTINGNEEAISFLQKAIQYPEYAFAAYILLGSIQFDLEDYRQSIVAYLRAIALADQDTVPADSADEIYQMYEPIIEDYTNNDEIKDSDLRNICQNLSEQIYRADWRKHLHMARMELSQTSNDEIMQPIVNFFLQASGGKIVESMSQIRQLINNDRYHSAMEEAFHMLQHAPTYLPLHIQIGDLLLKEGKNKEAETKFVLIAKLYSLRGEVSQSVQLMKRTIKAAPMNIKLRRQLIDLLISQHRIDEAIYQYIELAQIYYQLAELDETYQAYQDAYTLSMQNIADQSASVDILYKIADIDIQRIRWREAMESYEKILELKPDDYRAQAKIMELKFRLGRRENVMQEIETLVQGLERSNKRTMGIEFLKELLEERGKDMEIRNQLANLYVRNGQVEQAVKELDKIAKIHMNKGNNTGAISMLQTIIALEPRNTQAYRQALAKLVGK
ncbi:MAG: tetratricopeptide repeat protein [Anaerolineaceae bacterium]|nr:tetratricopeptide repeat protein [Anaerolineaceae bacterium]